MFVQELFSKLSGNAVGASETDLPVVTFGLSAYASLNLRVNMLCSGVSGTATVKIQARIPGGQYADLASTNANVVLSDGANVIRLNIQLAADIVDMPLAKDCRLVITTAAASGAIFDKITVQQG